MSKPGAPAACSASGLADARARTTARLSDRHRLLGFALGGEPGSRVADELAFPTSPNTLIRRVAPPTQAPEPGYRIVGIDDFALRKGRGYGTILIDLEWVIDLPGERDGAAVDAWLKAHPAVEVITRDRWAAYANAATAGAPATTQVADRFHLVTNLWEAVEKMWDAHRSAVAAAPLPPASVEPTEPNDPPPATAPRPPSVGEGRFTDGRRPPPGRAERG